MLKPGVLDAPGQAVARGLAALGFPAVDVRVGKVIELAVPEGHVHRLDEICARFLANPLIETWEIQRSPSPTAATVGTDGSATVAGMGESPAAQAPAASAVLGGLAPPGVASPGADVPGADDARPPAAHAGTAPLLGEARP